MKNIQIPPLVRFFTLALGLLLGGAAIPAYAQTWVANPASGDWNTAGNWTAGGPPNSPSATATFDITNTGNISISADTEVDSIVFNADASAYTITASSGDTLTISGTGITNNSATTQNFVNYGEMNFTNNATAGVNATFATIGGTSASSYGGYTYFYGTSTAGSGTFTISGGMVGEAYGGHLIFNDASTAGNGTFTIIDGASNSYGGGIIYFSNTSSAGSGNFNNSDGAIYFFNTSTAGNGIFTNNAATTTYAQGDTYFSGTSTAGNSTFNNNGGAISNAGGGFTYFNNASTAGNGNFINNGAAASNAQGGHTEFFDISTAGSGTFTNNGATVSGTDVDSGVLVGTTQFDDSSTAGNGIFINNGGMVSGAEGGVTQFIGGSPFGNTTAGYGTFTNNGGMISGAGGGATLFLYDSTGGNSTLINNGGSNGSQGGGTYFEENADGGTARLIANGNGFLDISGLYGVTGMNIGSIEGSGNFYLGSMTLTVGGNNLNTTVSGVIQDGGFSGGTGGSLVKTGTGTLTLSGINTYTGSTAVIQGSLIVNGSIASSSGVSVSTGASLGGHGSVGALSGAGTIAPGDPQILTATQVDPGSGMSFNFLASQPGAPTYGNAAASGNDVLHLTSSMPFVTALMAANTITMDFSAITGNLAIGQIYYGGFFLDNPEALGDPTFDYTGTGPYTVQYEGLAPVASADFTTGTVTGGAVMEFEVVPEPSSWAMLAVGASLLIAARSRIKKLRG